MMQKGCAVHASAAKDWSLTTEGCEEVAEYAKDYADACLSASRHAENAAQSIQQMGSAKMSLRSILSHLQVCDRFLFYHEGGQSMILTSTFTSRNGYKIASQMKNSRVVVAN